MPPKGKGKKSKKQLEEEKRKYTKLGLAHHHLQTGIAEEEKKAQEELERKLAEEEAERQRIAEEKRKAEEEKRRAEEAARLTEEMVSNRYRFLSCLLYSLVFITLCSPKNKTELSRCKRRQSWLGEHASSH